MHFATIGPQHHDNCLAVLVGSGMGATSEIEEVSDERHEGATVFYRSFAQKEKGIPSCGLGPAVWVFFSLSYDS